MYPRRLTLNLSDFFAGVTEYTFESRLGLADPPLIDYISALLARFLHTDTIYALRTPSGERLAAVSDMLLEADARQGEARRQVHQHIGDFLLFWMGLYPEAAERFRQNSLKDRLIDYREQGKLAYRQVALAPSDKPDEAAVFERLSHDFELCVYGLNEVRREISLPPEGPPTGPIVVE